MRSYARETRDRSAEATWEGTDGGGDGDLVGGHHRLTHQTDAGADRAVRAEAGAGGTENTRGRRRAHLQHACTHSHARTGTVHKLHPSFLRQRRTRMEEQNGGAEQRSGAELRSEVRTGGAKRSGDQRSGAGVGEPESRAEVEERRGGAGAGIREAER